MIITGNHFCFITPVLYCVRHLEYRRQFCWQVLIDSGKFSSVHELAGDIGKDDAYVPLIIRFTLLAPEILHAVLAGKINKSISTEKLKQSLPILWEEQKKIFDVE